MLLEAIGFGFISSPVEPNPSRPILKSSVVALGAGVGVGVGAGDDEGEVDGDGEGFAT